MTQTTLTILSQTTIDRMIQRRLAQAAAVLARPDLQDRPGEANEISGRILAEAIGWAAR